jgi:hypothetical protein
MSDPVSLYLLESFLTFAVIVILIFIIKIKNHARNISVLEGVSFITILAGIIYGNTSAFGYALICAGMIFITADLLLREIKPSGKKR